MNITERKQALTEIVLAARYYGHRGGCTRQEVAKMLAEYAFKPITQLQAELDGVAPHLSVKRLKAELAELAARILARAADDTRPTKDEREQLIRRAAKIVRDVLSQTDVKEQERGPLVKAYLVKISGKNDISQIPKKAFETMLSLLESKKKPEEVAAILRLV